MTTNHTASDGKYNTFFSGNPRTSQRKHQENHPHGGNGQALQGFLFKMPIKLVDSTLVSLTMPVYDWNHYTSKKGAVKMHTLLDYDCLLPEFVNITDGKGNDNKAAYDITVQPHSIGTLRNAVEIQIWTAMLTMLLLCD